MKLLRNLFICLVCFAMLSLAFAHATIVLGRLASDPITPNAGEQFTLNLEMSDPSQVPIEDAIVLADFSTPGLAEPIMVKFATTQTPGLYIATASLPKAGEYELTMRDQTFRQEEARANLSFQVLDTEKEIPSLNEASIPFVFPPTATGSNSIRSWLIWLIALPIVAGVVVTAFVLLNSSDTKKES